MGKEAEVRAGSVTAVHEMRVAARHLDVLLRVFRGYGPTWAVASGARVRGLIKALGAVRDCDVQIAFLDSALASRDGEERNAFAPIRERLISQQAKARARLLRRTRLTADARLDPGMAAAPARGDPRQRARTAQPSPAVVARELIREQARRCASGRDRIDDECQRADDFHEVRIRAKRLRYTLDAFASLYGDAAKAYIGALARLQTVLGEYHDSTVREQRFAELVSQWPATAVRHLFHGRPAGRARCAALSIAAARPSRRPTGACAGAAGVISQMS